VKNFEGILRPGSFFPRLREGSLFPRGVSGAFDEVGGTESAELVDGAALVPVPGGSVPTVFLK
jgi:hypothetical protein